eukprot:Skav222438  [mRNA]  locus=scaffold1766:53903:54376:+ [translate_table: standard]
MEEQIKEEAFEDLGIFTAVAPHLVGYEGFTELRLPFGGHRIGDAGAVELAAALEQLQQLKELEVRLEYNSIWDGALELAKALEQLRQLKGLVLSLEHNAIGDAGAIALAEVVRRLPRLKEVEVWLPHTLLTPEARAVWYGLQDELRSRGCLRQFIIE